ncbi:hypothetical protein AVEN_128521-1 [Araneus ventricosus]|uniref:Uncharacterized protein n=1 Tax=Araneus ventricosus TaxID=182803 RepID=A0A4Y2HNK4_ARAVE|nr:hypothetical protein AVEN_128521-1 [Araneus ventricosus]
MAQEPCLEVLRQTYVKLGIHEKARISHLCHVWLSFPPIQVEILRTSFTEAPNCATVALRSPIPPPPPHGRFPIFYRQIPKRTPGHSNQTSNYSEFYQFNPSEPIAIGF